MDITRTPGQSPMLPGAVRAGSIVYTSGVVAPSALGPDPVPFAQQAADALETLVGYLRDVGASTEHVVKVEAFLASADDFAAWNDAYAKIWPQPGPARTTLISQFAVPGVGIEIQAVAVL